jgi:YYY domain-containing protein
MNIQTLLAWYLTLQIFSVISLPLSFAWLRDLPSRGYAAAKALGLLLSGVLFWWGSILHIWPNTASAAVMVALMVLALGLWRMHGRWTEVPAWWQAHRTFVVTTEALFLIAFVLWVAVRATQPQLATAGGEKWMEIAFLNALQRSPSMPPHDPWLSGFAISYYYLGYLLLSMLTSVAGIPATIAFTLGNAAWFALAAVVAYGIVYDLLEGRQPFGPLLAPLLLLLTGNATGFLQLLYARGLLPAAFWRWLDIRGINTPPPTPGTWLTPDQFDWWRASRTLHDYAPISTATNPVSQEVIDEFPAFSFILGDMHPHLLALPFVLLAVALALNLWRRQADVFNVWRDQNVAALRWAARLRSWLPYAVVIGALGFLNTWDFPIYWALTTGTLLLKRHRAERPLTETLWKTLPDAAGLGLLSVLCYLPFWIGLRSQAGGILPNLFNATHPAQFAVMFAPFVIPVVGIVVVAARKANLRWTTILSWSLLALVGVLLVSTVIGVIIGSPYLRPILQGKPILGYNVNLDIVIAALLRRLLNPWTALALTAGVVALGLALLNYIQRFRTAAVTFPAILTLLGLGLTLAPEFVFLKDVFSTRMNTIFKFYFQAWILWSLAGTWWLLNDRSRTTLADAARVLTGLLILVGLVYPVYAVPARASQNRALYGETGAGTLDSAKWLSERHAEDYDAIQWLNTNVEGRPVILETPGDQHKAYVYEGRVSALTGLPTVLGWAGHERQWRGTYDVQARREQDLEQLFTNTDPAQTETLLVRYDVTYVYIGPTERARYPAEGLEKFDALYPAVYKSDGVTIYRVK